MPGRLPCCREWKASLLQRVEEKELQHRNKIEECRTLKKIQKVITMLEQNMKMDKSQQNMENLQGVMETGERTKDTYVKI